MCVCAGISPVQELKQVEVGVEVLGEVEEGVEGQAWIRNLKKQCNTNTHIT